MLELLAPAGSMEALRAAVQNGADAVYLGCGPFNARQNARNFTKETLPEAVKYCHVRGVKVHLTLNTLVSDRELEGAAETVRMAQSAGVDAFIVQDLGILELCRDIAPEIAVHASTQMSIYNLEGVLRAAELGCTRAVLSRELSSGEIARICQQSPIEIEVFGHGALCMCYSGQCYLSSVIGSRSGNRGLCAQPCRLPYGYGRFENKYPLSLKDNCLVRHIAELERMGVASLKLEGRMKKPDYVATVTRIYRGAIDGGRITRDDMQALDAAFSRQGFTDGYFVGDTGSHMFGVRQPEQEARGKKAKNAGPDYETVENPRVPVEFILESTEELTQLAVRDNDGHLCRTAGAGAQIARTRPTTAEDIQERLAKTGGTPYRAVNCAVRIAPGLSLSAAAINGMRREVLAELTALRGRRDPAASGRPRPVKRFPGHKGKPGLTVQVTRKDQVTKKLIALRPERLYVPLHLVAGEPGFWGEINRYVPVAAVLPRVTRDPDLAAVGSQLDAARGAGVTLALVGNLGQIELAARKGLAPCGDFGLNLFNSRSMNLVGQAGLRSVTASFEMSLPQIRDVSKAAHTEMLVYGRLPLMVTENCLIRGRTGACTCQAGVPTRLVDRTGADFPVLKDGDRCRSILLNSKKLYLLDKRQELDHMGLWALRLCFTTENPREVDGVLRCWDSPDPFSAGTCTRGLYGRGVE